MRYEGDLPAFDDAVLSIVGAYCSVVVLLPQS